MGIWVEQEARGPAAWVRKTEYAARAQNRKSEPEARGKTQLDAVKRKKQLRRQWVDEIRREQEHWVRCQAAAKRRREEAIKKAEEKERRRRATQKAKKRQEEEAKRYSEGAKRYRQEEAALWRAQKRRTKEQAKEEEMRLTIMEAWIDYEMRWHKLRSKTFLTFDSIPWPVALPVSRPESLLPQSISKFLLSPYHSPTHSSEKRISRALHRWDPSKLHAKVLPKVLVGDKRSVEEGVRMVVRHLNDLLAAECA